MQTGNTIAVRAGQNIYDIALQAYGSVEGVITLWQDNKAVFTDELRTVFAPGTVLTIRKTTNTTTKYFTNNNIIIATQ